MLRDSLTLTALARAGFVELDDAATGIEELSRAILVDEDQILTWFHRAADPDAALFALTSLSRSARDSVTAVLADPDAAVRVALVFGASSGLAEFFTRHPEFLSDFLAPGPHGPAERALPSADEVRGQLLASVGASSEQAVPVAAVDDDETAWSAVRVCYRRLLARVALIDLAQPDPEAGLDAVAATLSDLAAGMLDASLAIARRQVIGSGPGRFAERLVLATPLAIIGMGKAGARELNYVSDVDVIFVTENSDATEGAAVDVATRLAVLTMRGPSAYAVEPELWEVDANLRPEGKAGALVRTLESHLAYYARWAHGWEFQAQLKARPLAGDLELGERYVEALRPSVWSSAARDGFVSDVQRMRKRVTDNIPADEVDRQVKLGPGGLRDVEFTVQLLQLVHGRTDPNVRQRDTLGALRALGDNGYIGRVEAVDLAADYRRLRLIEHRLQLRRLRRTHLMPREERELRVLARATRLAGTAAGLVEIWESVKRRVRGEHERLFYRPLLSAVAGLASDDFNLTSEQAEARLAAIGFHDPRGALAHIAALTGGVSRRAAIHRHLLPVLLQWFASGPDPDYGLLVFRRLSEDLGAAYWYARMLRDSSEAASRLTRVLSGSRFAGELVSASAESVAWLEDDDDLRPRPAQMLRDETAAVLARHADADGAAATLRQARRREVLRLAFSAILGFCTVEELARGLVEVTENVIGGVLDAIRASRSDGADIDFAVIAMGRFGGRELGLGSDADVIYVFRARPGVEGESAHRTATAFASELSRLTADTRLPLDLDLDLRPEGKNGPIVRSLDAYRAYYARWSLTWEAQALLRARGVAGDRALVDDFEALADTVRYPTSIADKDVREVKRIKARVENERLPQGADPTRHLKLGRGSLSDVEWFVQLIQLQHAAASPALRTTSTLDALEVARAEGLVSDDDAARLRDAWIFASRARSAMTLWTNKTSDVLPSDRIALDAVARLLEYPPGSATRLEEDYLAVTRRARQVFDREFYGPA